MKAEQQVIITVPEGKIRDYIDGKFRTILRKNMYVKTLKND